MMEFTISVVRMLHSPGHAKPPWTAAPSVATSRSLTPTTKIIRSTITVTTGCGVSSITKHSDFLPEPQQCQKMHTKSQRNLSERNYLNMIWIGIGGVLSGFGRMEFVIMSRGGDGIEC